MTPEPTGGTAAYLAGLDLTGRRVVVVGAGQVAARRVPALLAAGADLVLVAPRAAPVLRDLAASGALRWWRRRYVEGDLSGAWYALALTDDPAVNERVAGEAERDRIFCVRGDRAALGTARTPASARHGDIRVGVLTGDPARSAALRDRIAALLNAGTRAPAGDSGPPAPAGGRVALVGGGPGADDLLTVRGRRLIGEADVIVADRLAPHGVLAGLREGVLVVDAAKNPGGRAMPQGEINALLVAHARAGRRVVRLKGGDPYLFGRGHEELEACVRAGVPCEVVPGVTSALAAPAAAGVPVTHRGLAHEVVIVSGHLPPGHPDSLVDWPALGRLRGTLVLLMAVGSMPAIAAALLRAGRPPGTPVLAVERAFSAGGRTIACTLGEAAGVLVREGLRPPAVVVIGDVVARAAMLAAIREVAGDR